MWEAVLVYSGAGMYFLRFVVATIFIVHAFPKIMMPAQMAAGMGSEKMKLGVVILGLVELYSSIALFLGFTLQFAAFLLSLVMLGAIGLKILAWKVPFKATNQTGWEFDLILLAANLSILTTNGMI